MHNRKIQQQSSSSLIEALANPDIYDHSVRSLRIIETHISWVILTGDYAYKIKKPVNFGFVDFSTLEKRRYYCEEELRLNRRFSSDIYRRVEAIRGTHSAPRFSGEGDVIEYAVVMRQFSQDNLLSHYATENRLSTDHIDSMSMMVTDIHWQAASAEAGSPWGSVATIEKWSEENFAQIESAVPLAVIPSYFEELKTWCRLELKRLKTHIIHRQKNGFVRECHGDLHLGNMAIIEGRCTAFDCIEFNEELRWIDIMSEIAFVVMDLQVRGYTQFSWHFLNQVLSINGDFQGLALLPYYVVYRALVRAKVEALQAGGQSLDFSRSIDFIDLARYWSAGRQPRLIVMHGLSGSGKSTVAADLASRIGAIQIRSDIERKRLFNLNATSNSGSSVKQGIYNKNASLKTYQRLGEIAGNLLTMGFNVIVDAACLQASQRTLFRELAKELQLPAYLVSCTAPETVLRERIMQRTEKGKDASEATYEVLAHQLDTQQPLSGDELDSPNTIICNRERLSEESLNLICENLDQS